MQNAYSIRTDAERNQVAVDTGLIDRGICRQTPIVHVSVHQHAQAFHRRVQVVIDNRNPFQQHVSEQWYV